VVAVMRARDLDHAFELADGVDYALTGGLFSRSPSALERARRPAGGATWRTSCSPGWVAENVMRRGFAPPEE
jgi:acyl-CoA reductase-like NAD-dependent aldehyde dehydrogenase